MRRRKELCRRTSSFLMIVVQLGWHCGETLDGLIPSRACKLAPCCLCRRAAMTE